MKIQLTRLDLTDNLNMKSLYLECTDCRDFGSADDSLILSVADLFQFDKGFYLPKNKVLRIAFIMPDLKRINHLPTVAQTTSSNSMITLHNNNSCIPASAELRTFCDGDTPIEFWACVHGKFKQFYPELIPDEGLRVSAHQIYNELPIDIEGISEKITEWSTKNFKKREDFLLKKNGTPQEYRKLLPFLGVGEELLGEIGEELGTEENLYTHIGKVLHMALKFQQGIRSVTATDVIKSIEDLNDYSVEETEDSSIEDYARRVTSFNPCKTSQVTLNFSTDKVMDCIADGLVFYLDGVGRTETPNITLLLRKTLRSVLQRDWNAKRNTFEVPKGENHVYPETVVYIMAPNGIEMRGIKYLSMDCSTFEPQGFDIKYEEGQKITILSEEERMNGEITKVDFQKEFGYVKITYQMYE